MPTDGFRWSDVDWKYVVGVAAGTLVAAIVWALMLATVTVLAFWIPVIGWAWLALASVALSIWPLVIVGLLVVGYLTIKPTKGAS
jgi:hypothetical protein